MLTIKVNPLYVEVSVYQLKSLKDESKNLERKRDYVDEGGKRARQKVIDYALNNDWDFFFTITFDRKKVDRYSFDDSVREVLNYFWYLKQYNGRYIKYLLVPEPHKRVRKEDGKQAIHCHGLIKLDSFTIDEFEYIERRGDAMVYEWNDISERFGRSEFVKLYNGSEFVGYYISKYISKALSIKISNHRYFKSNGLEGSDVISCIDDEKFLGLGIFPDYVGQFSTRYRLTHEQYELLKSKNIFD